MIKSVHVQENISLEPVRNNEPRKIPRIILVEDEIIVAMDVQQRLELLGYMVVAHATNGEEALIFSGSMNPDVILMDVKIRGRMDGIETAAKIRETLDVPIIYLTAFSDEATLKRASVTEAYGYLIKPFEDRELHATIEMALYKNRVEKKLRESEERYALAARAANDGIWDWDLLTGKLYYSARWAEMLGIPTDQLSNSPSEWFERIHKDDRQRFMKAMSSHLTQSTPVFECEYRIRHQNGKFRWMGCRGLGLFSDEKPYRMAGSQTDITDKKSYERELIHRALHDQLTGLHNRAMFTNRLNELLRKDRQNQTTHSVVLFLDLDNFKFVNDSLGHRWGDEILIQLARRLEKCLRPGDTISRFGGDEFAVLLDQVEDLEIARQIADRILNQITLPFLIQGKNIYITSSIGFLTVDRSYQSTEEILRDVDIAMYSAKSKGRNRYEIFRDDLREKSSQRLDQVIDIRRALENGEFLLYYQPLFALPDEQLVGFEALIRWQHPLQGLVLPEVFIPIAEETRLVIPIGDWVLRTACRQAQEWNMASGKPLRMAVNISRHQLLEENFISRVNSALEDSRFSPELLELEITESVAMENVDLTLERLEQLRQMGVRVSIDDFGSGYSSMDFLKRFPAKTLKIDRSFIHQMKENDQAIIAAVIQMAHRLQLVTVAEGVETRNQLDILNTMNCDGVQGFYLGRPMPAGSVLELINTQTESTKPQAGKG